MCRLISSAHTATLYPNVIGNACCPCVRPAISVPRCSFARLIRACSTRPRSRIRIGRASFSCSTIPVSMMSWVVAPQWIYSPESPGQCRSSSLITGTIGCRVTSMSRLIASMLISSALQWATMASAASCGTTPQPPLHPSKRRFHVQPPLELVALLEYSSHLVGAEQVFKESRIKGSRAHLRVPFDVQSTLLMSA